MLTSITRQCTEAPSADVLVDHRGAPVPDRGGAAGRGKLEALALGKQGLGVDEVGPCRSESPTSRLRSPSTYADRGDVVAVDERPVARGPCPWRSRGRHGAGSSRAALGIDSTCTRRTVRPWGCQVPLGPRSPRTPARGVGRRRFAGDGVDEPDPSLCPCRRASVGHLLPVRGEVGVREHLGVADLGRLLQIRVLHGQVPGAQHRVAAAAVDQVTVRAEADAPRIGGVPPFQRPAGGGVPDDELTVVGDRPHQRAVGGEPDVADQVPVSTQRVDRRRRWRHSPGARP